MKCLQRICCSANNTSILIFDHKSLEQTNCCGQLDSCSCGDHHHHHHHCIEQQHHSQLFTKFLTTNSKESGDLCEQVHDPVTAKSIRMRWQQIARDAFNFSLNQRLKEAQENGIKHNHKHHNHSHNHNLNNNSNNRLNDNDHLADDVDSLNDEFIFKPNNLIDLIALNTTVSNKILQCNRIDKWIQLSGHENSFALAGPGTIWKKHTPDSTEIDVYEALMNEPISEMIPKFYRNVQYKGDNFIELEDLLYHFKDASIMDIKMGTRTFLETEVLNQKPRKDLYEKMIRLDPNQLTEEEKRTKTVTKLRYMKFREDLSSSSNLGFRIEGFKVGKNIQHNKNLHTIKEQNDVKQILETFFQCKRSVCLSILNRLITLKKYFENSPFFKRHEIIGSSLLIIYTAEKSGVWMIDFAKTLPVPNHIEINHMDAWRPGNHEDGYLFGLNNLIAILNNLVY